jgi:integrase
LADTFEPNPRWLERRISSPICQAESVSRSPIRDVGGCVRLGTRFTGGPVLKKDFSSVENARTWIFGDAQVHKAEPGAMVELKAGAGESAFKLSAAQLAEAEAAFRTCNSAGLSLTEAVRFAVRHAKPPAGVISVGHAIEEALVEKGKSKRPTYLVDLGKRWRRFERWLPADKRKAINGITKLDIEEARKLFHLVAAGFTVEANEWEKNSWRERFGSLSLSVPPMDLAPIMAVGCFGGVRPEESARMTWEMVDFKRKHIDLPAEITKAGERRIVDISDNLLEWLLPYRAARNPALSCPSIFAESGGHSARK